MINDSAPIRVDVDVTNPGQFFACCGLLELANQLWPGAEGWFEKDVFRIECGGTLDEVFDALAGCPMTNSMTEAEHSRFREISAGSTWFLEVPDPAAIAAHAAQGIGMKTQYGFGQVVLGIWPT